MNEICSTLTKLTYTPEQRESLEKYYQLNSDNLFQDRCKLEELSRETSLTLDQVKMWLRNRRIRGKYKGRSSLAIEQVRAMEWIFTKHSRYISGPLKEKVAKVLGLTVTQIGKWFETRRLRGPPVMLSKHPIDNLEEWKKIVEELKRLTSTYPINQTQEKILKRLGINENRASESKDSPSLPLLSDTRTETHVIRTESLSPPASLRKRRLGPSVVSSPPTTTASLGLVDSRYGDPFGSSLQSEPKRRKFSSGAPTKLSRASDDLPQSLSSAAEVLAKIISVQRQTRPQSLPQQPQSSVELFPSLSPSSPSAQSPGRECISTSPIRQLSSPNCSQFLSSTESPSDEEVPSLPFPSPKNLVSNFVTTQSAIPLHQDLQYIQLLQQERESTEMGSEIRLPPISSLFSFTAQEVGL
mmetsp:Transcript_37638/g.52112  ORF Transcript_37638/g.52112 Transcript_37638/m.52112 type:complete len:412 (+) Transcript_37638:86-1321(+)|eukprot:CAMPEP_0201477676 /NCGR_PEP_ID=MMETSP0151_2-20130828/2646_1 /ASSEMBLY_ACC=CAM_ASM_000257 /TAXON_ID=200890 /ORGANISM="Paramoeba atlantica, Strain 621/1 / CCAP 1560/9" /LENGTH=411 /DNA_ID=CAMNT_0047858477 /DNA_START=1457 /DNA_END=2692 /DNA_ORIENTATION=+